MLPDRSPMAECLPPGWAMTPLLELCFIMSGGTPSKSHPDFWQGDIPWVSGKDLKAPRLYDAIDHVSEQAIGAGTRIAPEGSVFVLVRGMGLAKDLPIALAMRPMAFNQDIKALVPKTAGLGAFMRAAIYHRRDQLRSRIVPSAHGTMTLNLDDIQSFEIAMPSDPSEAKSVASALDVVLDMAVKAREVLARGQNLKNAVCRSLLTGGLRGEAQKETSIGPMPVSWDAPTVAESVLPFRFDRSCQIPASSYSTSGKWPIVDQGQSFISGYVDDEKLVIRPDSPLIIFGDQKRKFKFVDFPFALGADGTKPLKAGQGFESKYLYHALSALEVPSRGYNRHYTVLSGMRIPQPSPDEQREITSVLDTIDLKIDLHRKKCAVIDELLKTLMHKLMTGQIRVSDLDLSALAVPTVEATV